jgi:hypothetical protein
VVCVHEGQGEHAGEGVVHAWVGQKLLNCFIFKSFFFAVIAS